MIKSLDNGIVMNVLRVLGRNYELFREDIQRVESELSEIVASSRFLVLGGAGSIGQAVVKEIFKRKPQKLHVVDISENNLVELVRDLRSSFVDINGDFKTFSLDIGSIEFDSFVAADGKYDYVLNLSALKHVRSERDPFTLMRMVNVNILNTCKTLDQCISKGVKKYFAVSSDKAANPVNMMGASKRIMEMFLFAKSSDIKISTARFANVAFSDGSLLHGFERRLLKRQPLVAPNDIMRYFITSQESGELCLLSCIFGDDRDIFFPKLDENLQLTSFSTIAVRYLQEIGYRPHTCATEEEARLLVKTMPEKGYWPCLFSQSDTTGEKDVEEFFTANESLDLNRFKGIGVIKNEAYNETEKLRDFLLSIERCRKDKNWLKSDLVQIFRDLVPEFHHEELGKSLDSKM